MVENEEEISDKVWIKFLKKHWKMTLIIIAGVVIAAVSGFLLFIWFILPNALSTHIVPRNLSLWTVGFVLIFILNVILWEFLVIGIPVIVFAGVVFLLWWKKLPDEEKEEYTGKQEKKDSRRVSNRNGGGAISFLVFITWLIIVYVNHQWDTPFITWSIEYLIFSFITAFLWDLLIFGVPISVGVLIWIWHEMKEIS